jgi:hypothetical protein
VRAAQARIAAPELAVVRAQVKTDAQIDRERQAALDQTIERLRSSFDNVAGALAALEQRGVPSSWRASISGNTTRTPPRC